MSFRFSARAETTLAPSMPMNTQSVTSMVLFTWVITEPRPVVFNPLKSSVKTLSLKATATMAMNRTMGATLATVVIRLTIAAWRTPDSTSQWISHSITEAAVTACQVFPSPKTGKK